MRDIEFRGKSWVGGEWVHGYYFRRHAAPGGHTIMQADEGIAPMPLTFTAVKPKTVGQFTGVLDSNGKRIYEGDIVRYVDEDLIGDYFDATEVIWCGGDYPAFDLRHHGFECNAISHLVAEGRIEVIGNIHDNPELLQQTQEGDDAR